jgi:hypothetical protein
VSLGTEAVHAGWKAAVLRNTKDCWRTVLVERRAADRGAVRARFRRASILCIPWEVDLNAIRQWKSIMALRLRCPQARCTFRWLVRAFRDEWSLVINLLAPHMATECSSGIGSNLEIRQTRRNL